MRKLPLSFRKAIQNAEKHIRLLDTTGGLSQMNKIQQFMSDPDVQNVLTDYNYFQNVIGSRKTATPFEEDKPVVRKERNKSPKISQYAYSLGIHREKLIISNHKYGEIVSQASEYDFIIDGLALKIFRKVSGGSGCTEENLTKTEFWMISQLIIKGGRRRPISLHPHGSVKYTSAIKHLEGVRRKLEGKQSRGKYKIISAYKNLDPENKEFEFTPNEDLSWLLLMPYPEK